jgi:C4-dicarboxylate-specific signal transduction histidine kinase
MSDSGLFRANPIQGWQREAILKAAQLLRDRFGNPPVDAQARMAHDGLLEVLDPARRTVRLQRELSEATRKASLAQKSAERRGKERRQKDRRKVNLGPPPGMGDRRQGDRRSGKDRRNPSG